MTRRRQHRLGHVALFAAALLTTALGAQPDSSGRAKPASATLPESNEALLLSSRVEQAIQAGDYRLAVELLERMMRLPGGLVAARGSRTYYPIWREAFGLMARFPEEGVELYRRLYDGEVWARFQEAAATADLDALRELFRHYRLSSAWAAIGVELTAQLLDQGVYGEAIETLREMSLAGLTATPEQKAQLGVALASAGAVHPAERLLAELQSDPKLKARPEWRERLERLRRWFEARHGGGLRAAGEWWQGFAPRIEAGAVWTQALFPERRAQFSSAGDEIAKAVDTLRRLPSHQPVLDEQTLAVRLEGRLWAFDAGTLALRWSVPERLTDGAVAALGSVVTRVERRDDVRLSLEVELLLSNHLRHAVSVGFGQVYTVEGLTLFDADLHAFGQRPFRLTRESVRRNELLARELATGRLVWRTAWDPAGPLFDVAFQNVPLVVGDSLVAPIQRHDELNLAVLDPADGRLIREVPLVGPPTYFTKEGGRCLMISDETTLYVCTGNGVVAALGHDDLSWKWATVYPSTLAERLGPLWWQPAKETVELGIEPPVLADDLLVVAPVDSPDLFALDRFSGHERWRISRGEYPFLIGAVRSGLVVGGHALACLDLADPARRPPRWKSVPLQITGRAAIRDDRVYVPTREGIVVVDGQTGKVLVDQIAASAMSRSFAAADRGDFGATQRAARATLVPSAAPDRSANLLISDDVLFTVSPQRVVKYPDPRRARARCAALAGAEATSDRAELIQAWLDALEQRYEDAFRRLQTRPFEDPKLSAARDRLLTYIFLGLAQDTPATEDRLSWLQRAAVLADSPQSAARLALTIGRALEDAGRWHAALRHYGEMLLRPDSGHVADPADADRLAAGWLHAAERIRVLYGKAPGDSVRELVRPALDEEGATRLRSRLEAGGGEEAVLSLQRLRLALENEPACDQIDRLLTLQKLPPELKVQYLPKGELATLPVGLRRRLHLERWDTHVSLGLLDRARRDRVVWERQFADLPAAMAADGSAAGPTARAAQAATVEPLSPEEERERVGAIELAFRKLDQARGPPFTDHVARQWKIEQAELLVDGRRPLSVLGTAGTGVARYILVANLGNRRIELINPYKHQQAQRQTVDGMIGGHREWGAGSIGVLAGHEDQRTANREREAGSVWPVIIYQQLAAVPVRGGLVCLGLGPERYGGQRQWEYAVPEWAGIPADFADKSVAGRHGVYFTPRRDRIALVGWFDGQLWWQRELAGVTIERLYHVGSVKDRLETGPTENEWLVIVSDDQRAWVTDATFGRCLQRVPTGVATPRRIEVVGETIIVWGTEFVAGIAVASDPRVRRPTLRQIWSRPCAPVADSVAAAQRPWVAYRLRDEAEWHLLDARRGEPVFEAPLGVFDSISGIVADGDRLLVAGRVGPVDEAGVALVVRVRVTALRASDGTPLWSRDVVTGVAVNATQLAAHPDYVPILLARLDEDREASDESGLPAIQLINKHNGRLGEPLSIADDYRPAAEETSTMYMLATPTRMIVQVGGDLIAYGNSPLRSAP